MGIVKYNNISSLDLGLFVQATPVYNYAEKDVAFQHVNGRSGDIIQNYRSFKNSNRTYYFAKVFRPGEKYVNSSQAITEWLHSSDTYARLEDSYEPEYYRMAIYKDSGSFVNIYDQAESFEITFECKPQRWLIAGDEEITINSTTIKNPTKYDALPTFKIEVLANTVAEIFINGNLVIRIKDITENDTVYIDCENMECYSSTKNYNNNVELTNMEFPKLNGNEDILLTVSGCASATIKPRWWTL